MKSDSVILEIRKKEQTIKDLEHILALLSWDQETGMPGAAASGRARQMGLIQDQLTEHLRDERWPHWLEVLQSIQNIEVQRWGQLLQRRYREYQLLPPDFMTRFVESSSMARDSWLKSREADDFGLFAPDLKQLVFLLKERCECLGYEDEPYDALLDLYEPGMKASVLEKLFDQLQKELSSLIDKAIRPFEHTDCFSGNRIPIDIQKKISLRVLQDMGYDFKAGRLDYSVHPFTSTLGAYDIRVTTAFDENDFFNGLFSTIHEGGHGLYEQNLPPQWHGTVVSEACSLGFHESQSRLWENIIGRSRPFCLYLKNLINQEMPDLDVHEDRMFHQMNKVERSLIRVDADEMTYNLHIILRFRLERALINGEIQVENLPELWNQELFNLLGLKNESDRLGVLQDIHWSCGDMGYFPTYTLGNMFSAQIWKQVKHDIHDVDQLIEKGQFQEIQCWLKDHVHSRAALLTSTEMMHELSGSDPDTSFFIDYLKDKQRQLNG
ncbi:carboxypeptidase M32 [Oceanispirochaeta crateris]|uniref:Metal-dependent carboxypeptidase n=1 Tax=Oceanispirochaeta crateris TaxID=2518645 RepID=A0A5C1QIF1_9SPIO|nr:carboxypeptidase M32 [Oceanispirochaeta crateris]QEN06929.1 carboxypeptidase M32 [Oceanispirochaeta crateris]